LAAFLLRVAAMIEPTIDRFMMKSPHTIGQDQTLDAAHKMMRKHGIRHLPVLDGGKLVGIVSQRDLHFLETLRDVDPQEVQVNEAMAPDTFTTSPTASVRDVADEMAAHKYGAAVVLEHGRVVGVFTTVDALRALSTLLDQRRSQNGAEQSPSPAY
jgi:acetoin utilization protein AcuB